MPRSPAHKNRSGAVSGRSEPWRRTPKPLAQSAKVQSSPEPTQQTEARCRGAPPTQNPSGAASGRSEPWRRTPNPQRKARKILLPRAYSANGGPMPRSPAHPNRSGAVSGRSEPWRRTPQPLAQSAKAPPPLSLLSERRPDAAEPRPPKPERSGVGPERALEANTLNPLAQSAKVQSFPEPTQRPEARCRVALMPRS